MKKISQMLIDVAGSFITSQEIKEEVEVRVDITLAAWNIAILPKDKRKTALNKYLRQASKYAPSKEALNSLKKEMNKIIDTKIKLYPLIINLIEKAEIIENEEEFLIRAYYRATDGKQSEFIA